MAAASITKIKNTTELPSQKECTDKHSQTRGEATKSKSASQSRGQRTSKSTKSTFGSKRLPKLKRTLKRVVVIREFIESDLRYLWAFHKQTQGNLSVDEFKEEFALTASQYNTMHVLEGKTPKGFMPFGIIFGVYPGPFLLINPDDILWFPWASKRNIIEGAVKFINKLRDEINIVFYVSMKDKKFAEHINRHGITRKVGHLHDIYEGEPAVQFQSKRRNV